MVETLVDLLGAVLLFAGLTVATIGLIGMLRRRDLFEQLHAAGLITSAGAILVLLASIATGRSEIITSAVLVIVFVLVTSSLSAHAIASAGVRRYRPALPGDSLGSDPHHGSEDGSGEPRVSGPRRILLAHDGSAGARTAAELVAAVRWGEGVLVRVVAVQAESLPPVGSDDPEAAPLVETAHDLQRGLDEVADRLGAAGLRAETAMLEGDPVLAIVGEARSLQADLVVVGTRTLGSRSWLDGSTAGEIVDRAPCPVLVARSPRIDGILLSTDGSEASAAAAGLLERWSVLARVRLLVLAVASHRAGGGDDRAAAGRTADAVAERLRGCGYAAAVEVVEGSPASAITRAAARVGADLIVMGSRGRTGLTRTVLGSVTREVLTTAECSVLVINP